MEPRTAAIPKTVSIRGLKNFVLREMLEDHALRSVILAEKDELQVAEFIAKLEIWSVLLSLRNGG
jgi:hypothetical protein